ncbi:hypothetical protein NSR03_10340 [Staphylococcus sp. FSL W8-1207]|uniref:hypothetical protein n=1 Tax=Staphylococcus sp. FSL W8-1207 TaxID=2954711 RepID=UPI0030F7E9EC
MGWLNELEKGSVENICGSLFLSNNRTFDSLNYSLMGSKYTDEDMTLVVDGLIAEGYIKFEDGRFVDVGNAQQKLKDRGFLHKINID